MPLWPHQTPIVEAAVALTAAGRSCAIVVCTAGGKTRCSIETIRRRAVPAFVVVPTRQLVVQWVRELTDAGLAVVPDPTRSGEVAVQTIDAAIRREPPRVPLLVVDEAHNYQSDRRTKWLTAARDQGAVLLGLTATPKRLDGRAVADLFPEVAHAPYTLAQALIDGALVDCRPYRVHCKDDTGAIVPVTDTPDCNRQIVEHWVRLAGPSAEYPEGRPTVAFLPSIEWAESFAEAANQHLGPGTACALHSKSPVTVEDWLPNGTKAAPKYRIAASVNQFFEGFDYPPTAALIFVRDTQSDRLKVQGIGRGLRRHPGKRDCVLIDVSGAADNIDWAGLYDLEGAQTDDLPPTLTRAPGVPVEVPAVELPTFGTLVTWATARQSWAEICHAARRRDWTPVQTPRGPGLAAGYYQGRRPVLLVLLASRHDPSAVVLMELTWAPDGEPVFERIRGAWDQHDILAGHPAEDEPTMTRLAEAILDGHEWQIIADQRRVRDQVAKWYRDTQEPSEKTRAAIALEGLACPPTHGQAAKLLRTLRTPGAENARRRWAPEPARVPAPQLPVFQDDAPP